MANGRNRRQTRSALNRRARVQRFPGIGSYDYGPAAAINTDFGQIARDNLSDFRNVQETARKARERIDDAQKEASEAQDYEMTGVADVDKATMSLASDFRDHLREERNRIGKVVDGEVYTISDFVAFKNNVINNSKIWKGHPELIKNTLEALEKDETLDPITKEAYSETAGLILNPGGAYNVGSSRDKKNKGNITISGENADGTKVEYDLKNLAVNNVQEIKRFDSTTDIKDFQNLYAGKQQSFDINGQMYTVREVLDNPLLFTQHVKTEPAEFEQAKSTYLDNFMNDDQKVISYLRQMGKKVEYSHSAYEGLSDKERGTFDKIYLDKKGRFVVSDTLRDEARKKFKTQIDGAFGIEKKGDITKLTNYNKINTSGSGTPPVNLTVNPLDRTNYGGIYKLESGEPYSNVDIGISFARAVNPDFDSSSTKGSFGKQGTSYKINEPFIDTATQEKMGPDMKNRNPDIFTSKGAKTYGYGEMKDGKISYANTGLLDAQAENGNIAIEGLSIGVNLTADEISSLGITATSGGTKGALAPQFTSLSGLTFTYDRAKASSKGESMADITGFNIEEKMPKRILGLRLVGPITPRVMKETLTGDGIGMNESGAITQQKANETATSKETFASTSDMVSGAQITQLVELISRKQPNFETIYRGMLSIPNITAVRALYETLKESQRLQTPLNVQ